MSLVCWLPLNGNTSNQGISDYTMNGSPASWSTSGKIGTCATFSGSTSNVIYNNTSDLNYTDNFSFCLWINQNYTGSTNQYAFTVGRADTGGYGYGLQASDGSNITCRFGNKSIAVSCPKNEWHHIAFTVFGTEIKIYKDGILYTTSTTSTLPTYSDGNGLGIGCFHYSGNIYPFYGSINDFRIYDHCLSPLEVKQISQGLVCHYPLSNPCQIGYKDVFNGKYMNGLLNYSSSSFTVTQYDDYTNYTFSISKPSSSQWRSIATSAYSFTVNKKYFYRAYVRCNKAVGVTFTLRASRSSNDWVTTMKTVCSSSLADGEWHEYYLIQTIPESYDRSGSTVTSNPILEFYSNNLAESSSDTLELDFDLKIVEVIQTDSYIPLIGNNGLSGTIYDCSGYKNNGASNGSILWNSDSPRYSGSYQFNGSEYVTFNSPITSDTTEFSISCWAKFNTESTANTICTMRTAVGNGIALFRLTSNVFRFDDNTQTTFSNYTVPTNEWIHIVVTRSLTSKKLYINGELKQTVDSVGDMSGISEKGSIGASSASGSNYGNYTNGYLSDFRLYTTALSADDIKTLYNTSASISNLGVITAYEFQEVE